MLSILIWLPIVAAILLMVAPVHDARTPRLLAQAVMLVALAVAAHVFTHLTGGGEGYSFETRAPWLPGLGISYHLGVTRLGAMMILLTTLVGLAAVSSSTPRENGRQYYALGLIMAGGMAGAFASLDLFFMFIFHEFALIPTFLLVGIWGAERRREAAMKITLYLGFGSLILLFGLLALVWKTGGTFDLPEIRERLQAAPLAVETQVRLFGVLFLGFGILVSVFPFHTWAPIGYGEAPALSAMLHAGVIKKFGLFGLMTVAVPLLPAGFAAWKPWILWMALGNLLYCGYAALRQTDLRYLLAYSSVSHMGYAFLALAADNAIATQGLMLFMFAHGLAAAAGFGIAGFCREQTGTPLIAEMGGLAKRMPFAAAAFTMVALAGCGLPGFANFPAELLIFIGISQTQPGFFTVAAVWTAVISAVYYLRVVRNVFLGPLPEKWAKVNDVDFGRRAAFALLLAVLLAAGFWPRGVLGETASLLLGPYR